MVLWWLAYNSAVTMSLEGIEAEAVSRIMVSRRLQSRLEIK